jgi:lipopolysaccharide transport system ATP-binding protein
LTNDRPFWRASNAAGVQSNARILEVFVNDHKGDPNAAHLMGSVMEVRVIYEPAPDTPTHVNLELSNKYNQIVTSVGSSRLGLEPPMCRARQVHVFVIRITLNVEAGEYALCLSLGRPISANRGEILDTTGPLGPILVYWDYEHDVAPFLGICGLPARAMFRTSSSREEA